MDTTTVVEYVPLATDTDTIIAVGSVLVGPVVWWIVKKLEARFQLATISQSIAIGIALLSVWGMTYFAHLNVTLLGAFNAAFAILGVASQTKKTIHSAGDLKKILPAPKV